MKNKNIYKNKKSIMEKQYLLLGPFVDITCYEDFSVLVENIDVLFLGNIEQCKREFVDILKKDTIFRPEIEDIHYSEHTIAKINVVDSKLSFTKSDKFNLSDSCLETYRKKSEYKRELARKAEKKNIGKIESIKDISYSSDQDQVSLTCWLIPKKYIQQKITYNVIIQNESSKVHFEQKLL